MKEREDKYTEDLIWKVMKQSGLESPSFDFTSLVMEKIESTTSISVTTYQPLISKRGWFMIFGICIVFLGSIFYLGKTETSGWLENLNVSYINFNGFSEMFKGLQVSQTTTISIFMFGLMMLIQIPLLKNYLDKRI